MGTQAECRLVENARFWTAQAGLRFQSGGKPPHSEKFVAQDLCHL